jgi:hypothetical protein
VLVADIADPCDRLLPVMPVRAAGKLPDALGGMTDR